MNFINFKRRVDKRENKGKTRKKTLETIWIKNCLCNLKIMFSVFRLPSNSFVIDQ